MILDTSVGSKVTTIKVVSDVQEKMLLSPEFKHEAASLVLDLGYTTPQTSSSLGVGESAIRRWVQQLTDDVRGLHPRAKP